MTHSTFLFQPVGPKAGVPGTVAPSTQDTSAPAAASTPGSQGMWILFLPMVVLVVFMMFTSRSQKKREAEARAKLRKGDKVVSQSGLIGELIDMDDKVAKVKIAPGTNVQMLVSTLSSYEAAASGAASTDKALKDLKDAKATEKKG